MILGGDAVLKPTATDEQIADALKKGWGFDRIQSELKVGWRRIEKIKKRILEFPQTHPATTGPSFIPEPVPEAGGVTLPDPIVQDYLPYQVDAPGNWLVISDIHIPYHDKRTIETAVKESKQRSIKGIILNGDTLDFHQISRHYKEPDKGRTKEEILKGRQFLQWLRSQFPAARIIFKEGNHDERLKRYLGERAPEVFDLEEMYLPNLLHADKHGVEWVADKRVIELGKLCIVHGHEYAGGGGVMPARWLFIRAYSSAICGHFHQPSHYTAPTLDRREIGVWSLGCACYLYPAYMPQNKWRHGFAFAEMGQGGAFEVNNREILRNGQVV